MSKQKPQSVVNNHKTPKPAPSAVKQKPEVEAQAGGRAPRKAKAKALEDKVWLDTKQDRKRAGSQSTAENLVNTKRQRAEKPDRYLPASIPSDDEQDLALLKLNLKKDHSDKTNDTPISKGSRHKTVVPVDVSDDAEGNSLSDDDQQVEVQGSKYSDDDDEDAEAPAKVAKELFSEFPEVIRSKAKSHTHHRKKAKTPSNGHSRHSSISASSIWTSGGNEEPIASGSDFEENDSDAIANTKQIPRDLYRAAQSCTELTALQLGSGLHTAREQKFAAEAPSWNDENADDSDLNPCGSQSDRSEADQSNEHEDLGTDDDVMDSASIRLIPNPKGGEYRLTDQKPEIRRVVQGAILHAKAYMCFEHAYPELVAQNMYARDALVLAARELQCNTIEAHLARDTEYATILARLACLLHFRVEPRVPLMRTDAKDLAFAQVAGYYRLGHDCAESVKVLLQNQAYVYPQDFDAKGLPKPIRNKPYRAPMLIALLAALFFNGAKSVGAKFASRFTQLAKNKAGRPEVPIPMVALVATVTHAAVLSKSSGSTFKFSGNLFADTYRTHVEVLQRIAAQAPVKYHVMMADIYAAVQQASQTSGIGSNVPENAIAFLDMDGMDGE
ncbi:hypothetical protein BJ138DRAFT_1119393 [Hygrophoropsis aurantiaca]|uniref:Uncharacterized protein n=1 Tax=Hygrophoropsis aurantiaca TaxID=72124 RepID=A0ACB7ZUQ5_9AGAM|nr:hypothetical protein BJ138DRAFT_1119393 [Hygrophoropsis aurantiaca]